MEAVGGIQALIGDITGAPKIMAVEFQLGAEPSPMAGSASRTASNGGSVNRGR
jgi:hypothetical protein